MRLWTLHPRYLDPQGLVALWREALLARAVLRGETSGYRHHPQLHRFQAHATPRSAINAYLASVLAEADARGYAFNRTKVGPIQHLLRKLRARSPAFHRRWRGMSAPEPHPVFRIRPGPVEPWERRTGG